MNIGQKIKELRKKNNLTQEKLADHIGITYKSISKWECGLTTPDLSLIVPLSKVLGVSTDELLGAKDIDKRYDELENTYIDFMRIGNTADCIRVAEDAVKKYPSDMKWLNRYTWDRWCYAIETIPDCEAFEAEREQIIKLFDRVIGNTDDDEIKASAITGIVGCFCGKGCKKEARYYADLFPEAKADPIEKERLLGACLEGDEQICHKQNYLKKHFTQFIDMLIWNNIGNADDACTAAEGIINIMITDGNYCEFHHPMSHIKFKKAEIAMLKNNTRSALKFLKESIYHANEYDKIDSLALGEYRYTAPLFDHLAIDSREWYHSDQTLLDCIKKMCMRDSFDPIRECENFKALFE